MRLGASGQPWHGSRRLRRDPLGELCGHEKVDQALPAEDLALFATTYAPLDRAAMLQAGRALAQRYEELVQPLATAHGLVYPAALERVMLARLEILFHREGC